MFDKVTQTLAASEESQYSAIDAAFAQEQAKFNTVQTHYFMLSDAEQEALMDLCSFRCNSPQEYSLKAEYLQEKPQRESMQNQHYTALLRSMQDVA
jgi:hypothetical protein